MQQVVRGVELSDMTIVHHHHLVAVHDGVESVGDGDDAAHIEHGRSSSSVLYLGSDERFPYLYLQHSSPTWKFLHCLTIQHGDSRFVFE